MHSVLTLALWWRRSVIVAAVLAVGGCGESILQRGTVQPAPEPADAVAVQDLAFSADSTRSSVVADGYVAGVDDVHNLDAAMVDVIGNPEIDAKLALDLPLCGTANLCTLAGECSSAPGPATLIGTPFSLASSLVRTDPPTLVIFSELTTGPSTTVGSSDSIFSIDAMRTLSLVGQLPPNYRAAFAFPVKNNSFATVGWTSAGKGTWADDEPVGAYLGWVNGKVAGFLERKLVANFQADTVADSWQIWGLEMRQNSTKFDFELVQVDLPASKINCNFKYDSALLFSNWPTLAIANADGVWVVGSNLNGGPDSATATHFDNNCLPTATKKFPGIDSYRDSRIDNSSLRMIWTLDDKTTVAGSYNGIGILMLVTDALEIVKQRLMVDLPNSLRATGLARRADGSYVGGGFIGVSGFVSIGDVYIFRLDKDLNVVWKQHLLPYQNYPIGQGPIVLGGQHWRGLGTTPLSNSVLRLNDNHFILSARAATNQPDWATNYNLSPTYLHYFDADGNVDCLAPGK